MGLTAEKVAAAVEGQPRGAGRVRAGVAPAALKAQQAGEFSDEMTPIEVVDRLPDLATGEIRASKTRTVDLDEGPRADTSLEGLAKLRPVFARQGRGHRRQQLADQRRRRRADPGQREGASSSST